ncbi:acyltransferase family protein [Gilvimarinus polysaccharolyticus]|uniref:acyltransferase family protein n=1 Tax=Gilvimarinus polysaccharolyticus TaxID=863921 RepID=UPI0006735F82|nr:acyltransferase family protein [Gilvimarinus polysaccharolyticus]
MNTTPEYHRLDYLDAVRAFALLLGIVFHASLSFLPVYIGWAVMDVSTSAAVSIFMLISHSFRMALFFLVAGFFSHIMLHRHGVKRFSQSRLVRLAVPFIIGWFMMKPLLVSAWVMGMQSLRGDVSVWPALQQGSASLLESLHAPFTGTHLWFLYYLLLITAGVLLLRQLIHGYRPIANTLSRTACSLMHWLVYSRFSIVVLATFSAICLWFMSHWGMETPDKTLAPNLPVLLVYAGFFCFGWQLARQPKLMAQFSRLTWGKFALCLSAIVVAILLSGFEVQTGHPQYHYLKAAFLFGYGVMMWLLTALTIGVFKHCFNRPSKIIRYLADASYWLYLIHLPMVIWLQIAFAELPLHWSLKLALISAITVALSLLLYDLLVRSSVVGAVLNGRRKERVLFAGGRDS